MIRTAPRTESAFVVEINETGENDFVRFFKEAYESQKRREEICLH